MQNEYNAMQLFFYFFMIFIFLIFVKMLHRHYPTWEDKDGEGDDEDIKDIYVITV